LTFDWFDIFCTSFTCVHLTTDKQISSPSLKGPLSMWDAGLISYKFPFYCLYATLVLLKIVQSNVYR